MRAEFFLIPVAAATVCVPAHATVYLTVEQAQALMFPSARFTPDFRTLTDAQAAAIERELGRQCPQPRAPDLALDRRLVHRGRCRWQA